MNKLMPTLPVDYKNVGAVLGFALAVIVVVIVAKKLPLVGKHV